MNKKMILASVFCLSLLTIGCQKNEQPSEKTSTIATTEKVKMDKSMDKNPTTPTEEVIQNITEEIKLISNTFSEGELTIHFPQLTDMKDVSKQEQLNAFIQDKAISFLSTLDKNSNGEFNYTIMLQNDDLLSIAYTGVMTNTETAHPTQEYFNTNIDLKNGKELFLADFVTMEESFVENFRSSQYLNTWNSPEIEQAVSEYIKSIPSDELLELLNDSSMYLTNETMVISIDVPHAIGTFAEFEIQRDGMNF